jgi:CheY-like chemotaxis protein
MIPHPTAIAEPMEAKLHSKTILIVDDTPANIDVLSELLKDFKRKVATHGSQALALANGNQPPDLILLDIEMPDMDGFEVCRQLKANPATERIPVIFLTSNMEKRTTVQGFKAGACDFMTKPFDPEELMVRLRTQLELAESREQLEQMIEQMEISSTLLKDSSEELNLQKTALEESRQKSDSLLLNVLPEAIADELKANGVVTPLHYPIVSVLFADLVGFTRLSIGLSPKALVDELSYLFIGFDTIVEQHRMEKIKTLGDGYMAAGGIPKKNSSNPVDAILAAQAMLEFIQNRKEINLKAGYPPWDIRIGIHTGPVIAGVIGRNRFSYDIWGATVNTASRMETAGEPGRINISGITYQLVKDKFECTRRGNIEVKNMGKMDMYFVDKRKN